MTNDLRARIGASALFLVPALIAVGSVVACAANRKAEETPAGPTTDETEVVLTPIVKDGQVPEPAAPRRVGPAGGTFDAYYHQDAERHLGEMEASLKPLVTISAHDG